jgi:molybdenum cofactor cytidylyltransferase
MIAGLLLAAGRGRRFGMVGDKLLAPLAGRPVIAWSAAALTRGTDVLHVVVPVDAVAIADALAGIPHRLVRHAGRDEGMGSSLRAGIGSLGPDIGAVVVALADQPALDARVVERLLAAWHASGARAVAPRYRDGRGHPVLFARALFDSLSLLGGDTGARHLLDALGEDLECIDVEAGAPLDVDTVEALDHVARSWRPSRPGEPTS